MPRCLRYLHLSLFVILVVAACSPSPEEDLAAASGYVFSVDPQSQSATLKELSTTRLTPLQASAEPRVLDSSTELTIESFNFAFLPGNTLAIEASFKNISEFDFERPFSFSAAPGTRNIISSTEPNVSDADLGGDRVLSPGETTSPFTFEVKHKGESFSYFIEARAVVTDVAAEPEFLVNTTDDLPDTNPGDRVCETEIGLCSLRAAIEESNASTGVNSIILTGETYNIEGEFFEITDDLSIEGVSQDATVIATLSFFIDKFTWTIAEDITVSLRNLTLRGLSAGDDFLRDGTNGIENFGTLTLEDVTVTDNYSSVSSRAGVANRGKLSVLRSTISENGALPFSGSNGYGIFSSGELIVKDSQIIDNEGPGISASGSLLVEDSLIKDNRGAEAEKGGGIGSSGDAVIRRSTIQSNSLSEFAFGGGIYNDGTMLIENSLIDENSVDWGSTGIDSFGGGIYNLGTLTVVRSTLSNNRVSGTNRGRRLGLGRGGGLYNASAGTVTLVNSTLSKNLATSDETPAGGGIYNLGSLSLVNSTLNENASRRSILNDDPISNSAGALYNEGAIEIQNTIIANSDALTECEGTGTTTSLGNNLVSDDTCGLTQAGDLSDTDPLLGPLADNGGPTPTHALLAGSPAIDAGGDTGLATDQRGVARPQGAAFDIGSFEKE